jgi:hypothetical protein
MNDSPMRAPNARHGRKGARVEWADHSVLQQKNPDNRARAPDQMPVRRLMRPR